MLGALLDEAFSRTRFREEAWFHAIADCISEQFLARLQSHFTGPGWELPPDMAYWPNESHIYAKIRRKGSLPATNVHWIGPVPEDIPKVARNLLQSTDKRRFSAGISSVHDMIAQEIVSYHPAASEEVYRHGNLVVAVQPSTRKGHTLYTREILPPDLLQELRRRSSFWKYHERTRYPKSVAQEAAEAAFERWKELLEKPAPA